MADKALSPLIGKSLVVYLKKPLENEARLLDTGTQADVVTVEEGAAA